MNIPLRYKDRREEGQTTLRQCQFVQLHLLHVVDAICKEYHLTYFLTGGTLLGAMRHNGFIPWDDDLDIGMPREDYNRFLKIARCELPKDVILYAPSDTLERVISFSKLRDAYSFFGESSMGISLKRQNGIFLDIFPYDEVPCLGNWLERRLVKICKHAYHYGRALRCSGGRGWLMALFGGYLAIPFYAVHWAIRGLFRALLLILPCKNIYIDLGFTFVFPNSKKALFPLGTHVFEDGEFPVSGDPDTTLREQYGDWRQLPPVEKRQGGHSKLILPFQTVMVSGAMKWVSDNG